MAIAIALPGFNGLGRSVTPIFFSTNHLFESLSMFCEKIKGIFFVPGTIEFPFLNFSFCCMTTLGMATLGIIYEADPLVQNVTYIVGLR